MIENRDLTLQWYDRNCTISQDVSQSGILNVQRWRQTSALMHDDCMDATVPARRMGIFFWSFTKKYCTTSAVYGQCEIQLTFIINMITEMHFVDDLHLNSALISECLIPFGRPAQLWVSPGLSGPVTYLAVWRLNHHLPRESLSCWTVSTWTNIHGLNIHFNQPTLME